MKKDIEQLISSMTLEEKISLLAGSDMWHTVPIERLGIPAIRVTDGPNGARGTSGNQGPTSACFPCGSAIAATWNTELVERIGKALAEEVKSKGAHILLAPTVNIHRSPIAGRNFECYSEDPYLAGQMAAAYINGLQKNGVGACIKHFVCNDQEFERHSISSEVAERPLREIYLEPFRIAMEKAKPWSIMSSYNRINGVYANENDTTLKEILKKEWGFDGIVISDWYGTYDPGTAGGGLDVEMPGPARWATSEHVHAALKQGRITEADIDEKIRRILRTVERAGAFEHPEIPDERAEDRAEHRALIREAAGEAIVLLKNEGTLPLNPEKIKKLLVIGENAKVPQIVGGGSAHVNPHYIVSPWDGIMDRAGKSMEVRYTLGCITHRDPPAANIASFSTDDGSKGLSMVVFGNPDFAGEPVLKTKIVRTNLQWFGAERPAPGVDKFSLRITGHFTPTETGQSSLGMLCIGHGRLLVDDQEVIPFKEYLNPADWKDTHVPLAFEKGKSRKITVEYAWGGETDWRMVRISLLPHIPGDPIAEAEAMSKEADAVVIVAGLTNEWESEGFDRVNMRLPGQQDELIARVAAINKNTVVVLNAGSPLEMPWVEQVTSILQLWYPGQESGNALADVLFGDVNPSGKLPTTFPVRLEDNPAYINFPGENGKVYYGEGIYVGYRYYGFERLEPLFPFGHGLSYTTFEYGNLQILKDDLKPDETQQLTFTVTNTGTLPGKEIAQVYIRDAASRLVRPIKELKAFKKIFLKPGEKKKITVELDKQSLSYYDPAIPGWVAEPGEFQVLVGSSSRGIKLTGTFTLQSDI